MENKETQAAVVPFFNETRETLISRFISIFLTAILSALITFLQSLTIDPAPVVETTDQITQAGFLGAGLRAVVEFAKVTKHA